MANFTPVSAAIGGALIGLSAVLLMLSTGRIAGVSGIFSGLLNLRSDDKGWRIAFIAGLILAGFGLALAAGACTFGGCGGVGLVPVGVTSLDLSVLVGVASIVECDVGTSDVRPLAISDSGLCIMFCEGGKWLELPGGLLARSRLSTRSL